MGMGTPLPAHPLVSVSHPCPPPPLAALQVRLAGAFAEPSDDAPTVFVCTATVDPASMQPDKIKLEPPPTELALGTSCGTKPPKARALVLNTFLWH